MVVYKAIEFVKSVDSGGSTYPWIVNVLTERGRVVPYVVKLFKDRHIKQQHAVAKEVFGNLLACEFDLPVPNCALIDFTSAFLATLKEEQLQKLTGVHAGLKFGSEFASAKTIATNGLLPAFLKDYDLGTIFAFDNLLQNLDRGGERDKPNLLIDDDKYLLIDHEQVFPFANDANTRRGLDWSFDLPAWANNYQACYKHLFFPVLKSYRRETKRTLFDSFQEYLRYVDVDLVDRAAEDLQRLDVSVGRADLITDYLVQTQTRHAEFTRLLQAIIA